MRKALILSCILIIGYTSQAQSITYGSTNTWFFLHNKLDLNEKWSLENELHERLGAFLKDQGQLLIRPFVNFSPTQGLVLSAGYTFIDSQPYEPYSSTVFARENNIWEQVLLKQKIGKVDMSYRFRQEHRWVNRSEEVNGIRVDLGDQYLNRFRFRYTLKFPLKTFENSQQIFVQAFDEIWMKQGTNLLPTDLNRNWLYLGLGYKVSKKLNFQVGYMHQYDKISSANFISSPIIQVSIFKGFSLLKEE
ncbi:MAG: hypothetical protein ACI837_003138 [Crocinitomicaceae bacterium]|jgi:hypothetical protein